MRKIIFTYGIIGGLIVGVGMLLGITFVSDHGALGMVAGYLSMLAAFSMVFLGVRSYRDTIGGGVVRFWPAFGVGLAIAGVACLFYVAVWEVYLWQTGYRFLDDYVAQTLATMRADGASAADIAAYSASMDPIQAAYEQPLLRMLLTLSEIAPIGLVVALVSAALLRNPRVFPARVRS